MVYAGEGLFRQLLVITDLDKLVVEFATAAFAFLNFDAAAVVMIFTRIVHFFCRRHIHTIMRVQCDPYRRGDVQER
jgi:hypothetical protein